MSDSVALDCAALERRYRRLLAWFPAEHRRTYGEEMMGVLLASAPDGQQRPGPGDIVNLVSSGLRTRLRNWSGAETVDSKWGDALAAFSVVAPIVMIWVLAGQFLIALRERSQIQVSPGGYDSWYRHTLTIDAIAVGVAGAVTVALVVALAIYPALARRGHRAPMALGMITLALLGLVANVYLNTRGSLDGSPPTGNTVFLALESIALIIAPQPGRGWRVLKVKGLFLMADYLPTLAIALLIVPLVWRGSRRLHDA